VTLTEAEVQAIEALSRSRGKTPQEILHEAIDHFLAWHKAENRTAALRQARGIWKDRQDLPELSELGRE